MPSRKKKNNNQKNTRLPCTVFTKPSKPSEAITELKKQFEVINAMNIATLYIYITDFILTNNNFS